MAKKETAEKINSKKRKITIIIALVLVGILAVSVGLVVLLNNPDIYSTEQHIKRISKIVKEIYIDTGRCDSFEVNPLYSPDEEVIMYLVDFKPHGYYFVKVGTPGFLAGVHMYRRHTGIPERQWFRYRINTEQTPNPEQGKIWSDANEYQKLWTYGSKPNEWRETDMSHREILYIDSPFVVANTENEKRYLLPINRNDLPNSSYYVPTVKRNDKFFNLISLEEIVYNPNDTEKEMPCEFISFSYAQGFNLDSEWDLNNYTPTR